MSFPATLPLRTQLLERLTRTHLPELTTPPLLAGLDPADQARFTHLIPSLASGQIKEAAVLVPIVDAPQPRLLLTQRAAHLRRHAGQISFPGGRLEPGDSDAVAAALRESEEEIGLAPRHVQVIGYLPRQWVFTGYAITPVVGLVAPELTFKPDAQEVADLFEVPLAHLMNPLNHQARERLIDQQSVWVYDIPWGEHRIWGATAGIIMSLYRLLHEE